MKLTSDGKVVVPESACATEIGRLLALVHGDLRGAEEQALLEHIHTCAKCSAVLAMQKTIHNGYSMVLSAQGMEMPRYVPRTIREKVAIIRTRQVGLWLHELGKSILFQQPVAVDTINSGDDPIAIDTCLFRLEGLLSAVAADTVSHQVDISSELIADSVEAINDFRKQPAAVTHVQNAKRMFGLALAFDSADLNTLRHLGNYFYFVRDYKAALSTYSEGAAKCSSTVDEWRFAILLSIAKSGMQDFQGCFAYLDKAAKMLNNYQVDFHYFVNYLRRHDVTNAQTKLRELPVSMAEADVHDRSAIIVHKFFVLEREYLLRRLDAQSMSIVRRLGDVHRERR